MTDCEVTDGTGGRDTELGLYTEIIHCNRTAGDSRWGYSGTVIGQSNRIVIGHHRVTQYSYLTTTLLN